MPVSPGQMLSHYRLLEKIGQGGMGVVWKAEDSRLDREVAIKILPDAFSQDPTRLGRFKREAKAVAALNHPNIVTIYSVEDVDGVHFITMELVQGKPLTATISTTGLALGKFLDIAAPLVEAINAAHQKGITHRDLKPDNIMLCDDGSLRVLDFGLARLQPDAPAAEATTLSPQTVTQEGHIMGTVPYMSPEQLQGKNVDHRTDIFALGVIFYEMLSGRRPFQGATSVDLISSILKDTPSSVCDIRSDLPGHAGRLIARCLEKEATARFQATIDLRGELEALKKEMESAEKQAARSIAVLPFADMSPGKDQDYFCEGMAEEIINALTKLEGLRVTSRTSAFGIKESSVDKIGKRLGVNHILEGSVRKAGDRLRITAQLINVADDFHLWSERYDREMKDVFAIQDDIAQRIVEALRLTLGPDDKQAAQKTRTMSIDAYEYYLRGRKYFYRWTVKNIEFARDMFTRAVELDPAYALAHAGLADCNSIVYQNTDSSAVVWEQADAASRRAVELGPNFGETHASRGFALSLARRFAEAQEFFDRAIHNDPNIFEAYYWYGRSCMAEGKSDKAAALLEQALEVRPDDHQAPSLLGALYRALGRKEKSLAAARRSVENVEKHLGLNPDDVRARCLGAVGLVVLGQHERAVRWAKQALSTDPEETTVLYNVACVYSLTGHTDEALDCLEKAITVGFSHKEWLNNDPDFDPLRDHPRYQALLKRLE